MAGVGQAARVDPVAERGGDGLADDDPADRDVAGVDALGEGDEVGGHAPVLDREPLAAAREPGHHLVGDHDDAELVADRPHTGEITRRRHEHAVGADDRLEDDRGHRGGALDHDHVAQMPQRPLGLLLGAGRVERAAVGVRPPEVDDPRQPRLTRNAARVAGHRQGSRGGPVIGAVCREDLVPPGVQPSHPDGVLSGLGTAVGEEDHLQSVGGLARDEASGLGPDVHGIPRGEGGHPPGLLLHCGNEFGVPVADVGVDQARGEVQVVLAVVVPEPTPLRPRDRQRGDRALGRPRVEDVLAVVGADRRLVGGDTEGGGSGGLGRDVGHGDTLYAAPGRRSPSVARVSDSDVLAAVLLSRAGRRPLLGRPRPGWRPGWPAAVGEPPRPAGMPRHRP